jgi:methylglutaconyl-CoA hydratase
MTQNYRHLITSISNGVSYVTLNRPEVRNALNEVLIDELTDCFRTISEDVNVRVVILNGAGSVFCAGGDMNWMQRSINFSPEENRRDARTLAEMYRAIDECAQPVIACVHGAALGGGMGLCSVSDIVLAAPDVQFGFTEVKLGIVPAVISPFILKKIGENHARRYFLTSELFKTEVAKEIGLVHEILSLEQIPARAETLAKQILANGPQAVREAKKLVREIIRKPMDVALDHAVDLISHLRTSPEGQEGLRSFLEKRAPSWKPTSAEPK